MILELVLAGVDEAQAQLVEHALEQLRFLGVEVALRLLLQHRQQIDHLAGRGHVLVLLAGHRVAESPKCTAAMVASMRTVTRGVGVDMR